MRGFVAVLWCWTLAGCSQARPSDTRLSCFDYPDTIQLVLDAECGECHSASRAEGGYRTDSYPALLEPGQDGQPRVIPGETGSSLLARARGENNHAYTAAPDTLAILTRWVVDCRLSYLPSDLVHPYGWSNPADPEFHGAQLRDAGYDLTTCIKCHGDGNDGGPSQVSCNTCHPNGVGACDTCHGDGNSPWWGPDGPGPSAHDVHLAGGSVLGLSYGCDECHDTPANWRDVGHIFDARGVADTDGRAEVAFGALAGASVEGREERRTGPPSYDPDTGSCANVYCHGGALAARQAPVWTVQDNDNADCALCHAEPPGGGTHAAGVSASECVACHARVIDASSVIASPELHIDGRISLGDGSDTCASCHGSGPRGAPPPTFGGTTASSSQGVGAHAAHLGANVFTGPVACAACHVVPSGDSFVVAVAAAGHVDTALPAEVFPDDPRLAAIARAENAAPAYDRGSATCSDVYCHGGGDLMSLDQAPGIARSPVWTDVGAGSIVCGSCHGVPMTVGTGHLPTWTRTDCVLCHAAAIDGTGAILFAEDGTSRHINGRPDFNQ